MSKAPRILAFAGSARKGSYNKRLVRVAADGARKTGADVTLVDLADFPMPIYNADLEKSEGIPENAQKFKKLMVAHNGILISSPEYNSSISALLKNTLDWASRRAEGEPKLAAYDGKIAGIMAASTGALGGLRGLVHLRAMLENIRVIVVPEQKAVAKAGDAFDEDGSLKDEQTRRTVEGIGARVAELLRRLAE